MAGFGDVQSVMGEYDLLNLRRTNPKPPTRLMRGRSSQLGDTHSLYLFSPLAPTHEAIAAFDLPHGRNPFNLLPTCSGRSPR